jgi:hypothetical protein
MVLALLKKVWLCVRAFVAVPIAMIGMLLLLLGASMAWLGNKLRPSEIGSIRLTSETSTNHSVVAQIVLFAYAQRSDGPTQQSF